MVYNNKQDEIKYTMCYNDINSYYNFTEKDY